jgi:hypothetical protein
MMPKSTNTGVKEAVAQSVAQEGLDHRAGEMLQVEALGLQPRLVVERRAVDPVEGQHVPGGAVPVHGGNAEVGIAAGVVGHLGERRSLQPQVHLDRNRAAQGVHRLDHAKPPRLGRQGFGALGGKRERIEIDAKALLDAGAEHLDRHRLAAVRRLHFGTVHLRDRGRGDRIAERGKRLRNRAAQRGGHGGFRLRARERRHAVLQALQVAGDRDADHVGPRRQELAELHIGRPEPGQRGGEPVLGIAGGRALDQAGDPHRQTRRRRQLRRVRQRQHAFARHHVAGAAEADEVGDRGDHSRQPEWMATMPPVSG